MGKPFLDETRLRKALKSQGFTVMPTSNGARVMSPDGAGTAAWHASVFKASDANRSYRNFMADLVRIGFDLDAVETSNGQRDAWRVERRQIESMLSEDEKRHAQQVHEDRIQAERVLRLRASEQILQGKQKQLFELVRAEPGNKPAWYADKLPDMAIYNVGQALRDKQLIHTTGSRRSARWWAWDSEVDTTLVAPRTPDTQEVVARIDEFAGLLKDVLVADEQRRREFEEMKQTIDRIRKLLPDD